MAQLHVEPQIPSKKTYSHLVCQHREILNLKIEKPWSKCSLFIQSLQMLEARRTSIQRMSPESTRYSSVQFPFVSISHEDFTVHKADKISSSMHLHHQNAQYFRSLAIERSKNYGANPTGSGGSSITSPK